MIRHLVSIDDIDSVTLNEILGLSERFREQIRHGHLVLTGKKLGVILLFYQPSTRTITSFEIAARLIGMPVLSCKDNATLSTAEAKGESFENTIANLCYPGVGIIVIRHPVAGQAKLAAEVADKQKVGRSTVRIINAGDGSREHPTQGLQDCLTMLQLSKRKRPEEVRLVLANDIANSRVFRSTLPLFIRLFKPVQIGLCAPEGINLPPDLENMIREQKIKIFQFNYISRALEWGDFFYVGRPQSEYVDDPDYAAKFRGFQVTRQMLDALPPESTCQLLHAQPIVNEISKDALYHPRSQIWKQKDNGLYVRMACLELSYRSIVHPA